MHKGVFNNYVDRILPFSDPPPLRGQFLYPERGQKQTFFDPPPHLVHVVIESPSCFDITKKRQKKDGDFIKFLWPSQNI